MARRRVWVGSNGPFLFDDVETYADGVAMRGIRSEGPLRVEGNPAAGNEVGNRDYNDARYVGGGGGGALVIRSSILTIEDATAADNIQCTLTAGYQGDSDGPTDDIPDNGSNGNYALNLGSTVLTIDENALSGACLGILAECLQSNDTTNAYTIECGISGNDITVTVRDLNGAAQDLGGLVDLGTLEIRITYITDA